MKRGYKILIIVLSIALILTILALVFGVLVVRNLFRPICCGPNQPTYPNDVLSEKNRQAINELFNDEEINVAIALGVDNAARIKQGTERFSIAFSARSFDGDVLRSRDKLKYKLKLQPATRENCMGILGEDETKNLFFQEIDQENSFLLLENDRAYSNIEIGIPKDTQLCTQRVIVEVVDTQTNQSAGTYFNMEIIKKGFF